METLTLALDGPGRARGNAHGESLREAIREGLDRWRDSLARDVAGSLDDYISELLNRTSFTVAIDRWAPDLGEEVIGLAEGAGVDRQTMLAFQLVDEEWWFRRNRRLGLVVGEKCSVVGIPGTEQNAPLLAQNLDIPTWCDGLQVLLQITLPDSDLKASVFSYAGLIALTGLNDRSIAVTVNALMQLNPSPRGLPVAFVVRALLAKRTFEDAERLLLEIEHASGQAYTLGSRDRIVGYECSARGTCRYRPREPSGVLCHSNHPLANDDQQLFRDVSRLIDPALQAASRSNTERRLASLVAQTEGLTPGPGVDEVAAILRSHDDRGASICAHDSGGTMAFTAWSVIYELGERPRAHFTVGPPCRSEFRTAELTRGQT